MKIILPLLFISIICSCSNDNEIKKSVKHRSAQERINAGQSGADSITKELD